MNVKKVTKLADIKLQGVTVSGIVEEPHFKSVVLTDALGNSIVLEKSDYYNGVSVYVSVPEAEGQAAVPIELLST